MTRCGEEANRGLTQLQFVAVPQGTNPLLQIKIDSGADEVARAQLIRKRRAAADVVGMNMRVQDVR